MNGLAIPGSGVTYRFGTPYAAFLDEAAPLMLDHWDEIGDYDGVLNLNPAHEHYQRAEQAGALKLLVARRYGIMCGYFACLITPHPRDRNSLAARDSAIYVTPSVRGLGVALGMVRRMLSLLEEVTAAEQKTMVVYWHRKARGAPPSYLQRLGFTPYEVSYSKVILP